MQKIRLGRTNIEVDALGFGVLPLQRTTKSEAVRILRRAHDEGVQFFETARVYTDSEEKIGAAFANVRQNIIIATKAKTQSGAELEKSLETSLRTLKTDYIDILQMHNPSQVPIPEDGTGRYEAMHKAKKDGKVRFLGLTAHALDNAIQAARSGLYDTIQHPFSMIASDEEVALPFLCKELDVGFLAMKALGGGLIRNIKAAYAFVARFDNVLPLWGIQRMVELEDFLAFRASPPAWTAETERAAEEDRKTLGATFCRACAYCLPCPMNIDIPFVARVGFLPVYGMAFVNSLGDGGRIKMQAAKKCKMCGVCASRCPYTLNTPDLVRANIEIYESFLCDNKLPPLE